MSQQLLPVPPEEDDERRGDRPDEHSASEAPRAGKPRGKYRRQQPQSMTVAEIVAALRALSEAVALNLISPSRASAMRACYDSMLRALQSSKLGQERAFADDDVLRMLREQPALLSIFERFLSDAQIQLILGEEGDRDDE